MANSILLQIFQRQNFIGKKRGVGKNIEVFFFFGKVWLEVEGWIICNSLFLVSMYNVERNLIWQIIVNNFLVTFTFWWGDFIISKRTFLSVKFSFMLLLSLLLLLLLFCYCCLCPLSSLFMLLLMMLLLFLSVKFSFYVVVLVLLLFLSVKFSFYVVVLVLLLFLSVKFAFYVVVVVVKSWQTRRMRPTHLTRVRFKDSKWNQRHKLTNYDERRRNFEVYV